MPLCVIRGSGDIGSAVAHALFSAGHRVVIHDIPAPTHSRRGMAFTDAMFDGRALLEGVAAKRARDLESLAKMLACGHAIPMTDADIDATLEAVVPDVLVDARMRKHDVPERQKGLAPLTIGLGPGFVAGETTDLAVETAWGDALGQVIESGASMALAGEPQRIAGHARDRYVYAPTKGRFLTQLTIGDRVVAGQSIATVGAVQVRAPLDGVLRGIARSGVQLTQGSKIVEIDPRGDPATCFGIAERPRRIAEGVLEALCTYAVARA